MEARVGEWNRGRGIVEKIEEITERLTICLFHGCDWKLASPGVYVCVCLDSS